LVSRLEVSVNLHYLTKKLVYNQEGKSLYICRLQCLL